MTPFILAGAMSPATVAGDVRADARGVARRDGVHPARPAGRPGRARLVRLVDVDAVRRADLRHARAGARPLRDGIARAAARRAVPVGRRADGVEDRRRAGGLRVREHDAADDARRRQLRPPRGRLARGRAVDGVREVRARRRPARHVARVRARASTSPRTARRSTPSARTSPGTHFLGHPHTLANFETAFYRSPVADNSSFEQWESEGAQDAARAGECRLEERRSPSTSQPPIDDGVDEELREWIEQRKASFPDGSE